MMWRGFELDGYERELNGVSGVITGKILKMESHPNANKLTVCQVDLGDKTAQILTNAKNVFEGAVVPVAYAGAKIGSQEFTVANIRGVESYGMFCSGQEFNLTESEFPGAGVDGILILPVDTPLGMDIAKALGRDDVIFDFADTKFCDSSGIGVIMGRYRKIYMLGGEVCAVHTSERIRKILMMSGVTKIMQIYEEEK